MTEGKNAETLNDGSEADSVHEALRDRVPLIPPYDDVLDPGFERYALERTMFGSESGYMGIGPAGLELGDKVAIIKGLEVPLILREMNDDYYEVVGGGVCAWRYEWRGLR